MKNLKFRTQLMIGFGVIILFSIISNAIAVLELKKIKNNTDLIIKHPFTVSNAVKDININITAIHRTMKDLALAETQQEFESAQVLVNHHDSLIHRAFNIVIQRYLGEKQIVMDIYKSYNQWEIIRNEVIRLKKQGKNSEAIAITRGKGDAHVKFLIRKTNVMIEFALNKANSFHVEINNNSGNAITNIIIMMIILSVVSVFTAYFLSRNILRPIHDFISQIGTLFLTKQISRPSKLIMDEKALLAYSISELNAAYNKITEQNKELNSFNEKLEKEINEKTQELQSINEEYKNQNNRLAVANRRLEESEKKFRHTFDNANIGVCIIELNGRISKANQEMSSIFGYMSTELEKMSISDMALPEFRDANKNLIRKALDGEIEKFKHEKKYFRKDQSEITCIVSSSLVRDAKSKPMFFISHIQNITEQKEMERSLQKNQAMLKTANATKDKFLSIISHDLKSPFSSMLGLSNLLLENFHKYSDSKRVLFLQNINQAMVNTSTLLEDLLMWSKSQTKGFKVTPKELLLEEMLKEIIDLHKTVAEKKNITIELNHNNLRAFADMNSVKTIIRNLISNAVKFSFPNSKVLVKAEPFRNNDTDYIKVSVKDFGVGIDKPTLHNLFRIGKNISTAGTDNETGTGLGLILCQEFVEKNNGKIGVESEPNAGALFWFTIPASEAKSKDANRPQTENRTKKSTILIVDDDETNHLLLKALLENELLPDLIILHAKNGEEAVDTCKNNKNIHLVLMDIKMPIMDGHKATKLIRNYRPELPIVILTSSYQIKNKEEAIQAGCNDFIIKPINKSVLMDITNKYLLPNN